MFHNLLNWVPGSGVVFEQFFCQGLEWGGHFVVWKAGKGDKEKTVNALTKWQNKHFKKSGNISGLNTHPTIIKLHFVSH